MNLEFNNLNTMIGKRFWEYNSQRWLTLEKVVILCKEEYLQFTELNHIVKFKNCKLYLTEIKK